MVLVIKNSLGEESVKLEPVDECMMMDIGPAGTESMVVMEPENGDMVSIILVVEAGPGDKEIKENENNVFEYIKQCV